MAKLYATLENSKGKTVSVSDNEEITATVYEGNMKAYSVRIQWTDIGDIIDDEGNTLPDNQRTLGAIITTREWRNEPEERRKRQVKATGKQAPCMNCGSLQLAKDINYLGDSVWNCPNCK